eukprot:g30568.t1
MQPEPLPEVEAVETVSGPSLEQLEKLTLSLESATQEIAEAHEKKQQAIDRYTAEEERAERAEEREVEALSRLEQAETRVEQAEMTVESLEKERDRERKNLEEFCHEHINQEKEMREMCEAQCKSLEEELRQTQQTLRVAQHAAKQSTKDSSKAQEKQVALEEQLLAQSKEKDDLQRRLKHDDESILKLKEGSSLLERGKASLAAEVKAFHAKAAEKEAQEDEDIVLVGWDGAGKPVDSEDPAALAFGTTVWGRCAERRELEYWQDCIERLSREDQWLTAECQSLEQDKDLQEQAAESLFNEMLTLGIPPEQRAYAMLLSAYGNAKQQQDASQLFLKMPRRYQEDGLVREAIWRCFGKDAVQVFREAEASRPGAARPGKASKANR